MRVCVLSYNSVIRDARILKEAKTLASSGYDVTVIGLADSNYSGNHQYSDTMAVKLLKVPVVPSLTRRFVKYGFVVFAFSVIVALYNFEIFSQHKILPYLLLTAVVFGGALLGRVARKSVDVVTTLMRRLPNTGMFAFARIVRVRRRHKVRVNLLAQAVSEHSPDVIHCHDLLTLPAAVAGKNMTGAKLVWDAHEIYEEVAQASSQQKRFYRRILQSAQDSVDGFVTINESIAEFYRKNYPSLPSAVIVKNATVKMESFEYDGRLHKAANIPENQKILLYQGGYAEKRGLRQLVNSAEYLTSDWTLVMMGWGRLDEELRDIGNRVNKATSIREVPAVAFVPGAPQEELPYWTGGAKIGVIPYENTGLNHLYCTPNKLWEYPNAGVPILCSPLVEMSKVIDDYHIGWLLPENIEAKSIASVVNELSDLQLSRAKDACEVYIDRDNWSIYESYLLGLYSGLNEKVDGVASPSPAGQLR